jgi:hypothetical protein
MREIVLIQTRKQDQSNNAKSLRHDIGRLGLANRDSSFDNSLVKSLGKVFGVIVLGGLFAAAIWFLEIRSIEVVSLQHQAQSFPKTEGRIISAQIITRTGSRGRIYYHPAFVYSYAVPGYFQSFTGRRYRYDGFPSDQTSANQIVEAHPAGSAVTVYYNPRNPADTLLSPGVLPQDLSPLFLFTPVICMMGFMLLKLGGELEWAGKVKPVAGGVQILTDRMTTRVRLPRYQASGLGLKTAGILSVVAGFVFQFNAINDAMTDGLYALLIVIVAGAAVYLWQAHRLASGIQDLVIDEGARTVELPLTYKRRERHPLPFSEIKAVTLKKVAHRRKSGVSYTYAPTLQLREGSSEQLTDLTQSKAESFAEWLREKLGVPLSGASPDDTESA